MCGEGKPGEGQEGATRCSRRRRRGRWWQLWARVALSQTIDPTAMQSLLFLPLPPTSCISAAHLHPAPTSYSPAPLIHKTTNATTVCLPLPPSPLLTIGLCCSPNSRPHLLSPRPSVLWNNRCNRRLGVVPPPRRPHTSVTPGERLRLRRACNRRRAVTAAPAAWGRPRGVTAAAVGESNRSRGRRWWGGGGRGRRCARMCGGKCGPACSTGAEAEGREGGDGDGECGESVGKM